MTSKKDDVSDADKASLENAVNNSQGDPRQVTEKEVEEASPPPVEPDVKTGSKPK